MGALLQKLAGRGHPKLLANLCSMANEAAHPTRSEQLQLLLLLSAAARRGDGGAGRTVRRIEKTDTEDMASQNGWVSQCKPQNDASEPESEQH